MGFFHLNTKVPERAMEAVVLMFPTFVVPQQVTSLRHHSVPSEQAAWPSPLLSVMAELVQGTERN